MASLTVRISDDLHAAARKAAAGQSLTGFVREAIAEKVGRAHLDSEVAQLRERVELLERQARTRPLT